MNIFNNFSNESNEKILVNEIGDPLVSSDFEFNGNSTEEVRATLFGITSFSEKTVNFNPNEDIDNNILPVPEMLSEPVDVIMESLPDFSTFKLPMKNEKSSSEDNTTYKTHSTDSNSTSETSQDLISNVPPSIWETVLVDYNNDVRQMISWESIGKSNFNVNGTSPYLTEANISTYEAVWQNHFYHEFSFGGTGIAIHQEILVQDILFLILGTPSKLFSYDPIKRIFRPNVPNIRIQGCSAKSINNIMNRFLNFGTHIIRLETVAETCTKSAHLYGLTGVAFGRSLASFVSFIRKSISAVAEKLNGADNIKIVRLYHTMDESSLIVERIAAFCCCDVADSRHQNLSIDQKEQKDQEGFYLPFGSGILSEIYSTIKSIDAARSPLHKSILLAFLKQSSEPLFHMLNSWLGVASSYTLALLPIDTPKGEFYDPYEEFFIANFEIDTSFVKHDGDGFWQHKIKVDEKNVLPIFISPELARDVLEAGKSLRLLRDCRPNHPLFDSSIILDKITGKLKWDINLKWLFIQGDIDEMQDQLQNYFREMIIAIVTQGEGRKSEIANVAVVADPDLEEDSTTVLIERLLQVQSSTSSYAHKDYILPLVAITEQVVARTILCHCRLINASMLSNFFHDLGLRAHLNVLRDFMLMGNGIFVSGLSDTLFNSDNIGFDKNFFSSGNTHVNFEWIMALSAVIAETVSSEKRDFENNDSNQTIDSRGKVNDLDNILMFGIRGDDDPTFEETNDPNSLAALDFLYLEYKPPYPINVIITPTILKKYNVLFKFLLRVLRLKVVVQQIYRLTHERYNFGDKEESAEDHDLIHRFRFEAQQFVSAIYGYIFDIAIFSTWKHFMKRLDKIAKESEFELPKGHLAGEGNSDATSYYDDQSQSDSFSNVKSEDLDEEFNDDIEVAQVKDLASLLAYHDYILNRLSWQCLLKRKQLPLHKFLNGIFTTILDFSRLLKLRRSYQYNSTQRNDHWNKIKVLYSNFRKYSAVFLNLLIELESSGNNKMSALRKESGTQFRDKIENQFNLEGYLHQLVLRLDFNGYYSQIYNRELNKKSKS
ncbi:hypothetical protein Glove_562g31 [Diversispora epigaea]|uniref:Spindle pole body component n=1 Tax=Diversispora epigaea TaxID=1348612 RepID=A0A397GAH7_9GLOM|nr:hypothetical protein Glove_562g31 [Diversispora epigaea]